MTVMVKLKRSRSVQFDLEHKSGMRSIEDKCRFKSSPGHQGLRRSALSGSEYGKQLRMKQLIRFYYLVTEKQFVNLYKKADKQSGSTGLNLLLLLESRLDNLVYRAGFACTRREARQLVSHGHIKVNGRRVTVGSFHVRLGDQITLTEKARQHMRVQAAIELAMTQREPCGWLEVDNSKGSAGLTRLPELQDFPSEFNVNMVVEFYSK